MAALIDNTPFAKDGRQSPSRNDDDRGRILLVDDQWLYRETVASSLREHNFDVRVLDNGRDTLPSALSWNPHAIILDIGMRDTDGFAVCKELKGDSRTQAVPVIFFSWQDDHASVSRGFRCGAVEFISKGMPRIEMIARVAAQVRTRQSAVQSASALRSRIREIENEAREWQRRLLDLIALEPADSKLRQALTQMLQRMRRTLDPGATGMARFEQTV